MANIGSDCFPDIERFEFIFTSIVASLESYIVNIVAILVVKQPFGCHRIPQLMISLGPGNHNNRLCSVVDMAKGSG